PREEGPADEVVARRRHAGAKAEQRRRGLGRAGRVVGGTRARERVGAPAGGLQREREWPPGEPAAEATRWSERRRAGAETRSPAPQRLRRLRRRRPVGGAPGGEAARHGNAH